MGDTSKQYNNLVARALNSTEVTSSRLVKTGNGAIHKVIINSNTSGSIKLFDSTTYGTAALGGTYTPTTATSSVVDYECTGFDTGLFVAVGGTANLTVIYE